MLVCETTMNALIEIGLFYYYFQYVIFPYNEIWGHVSLSPVAI